LAALSHVKGSFETPEYNAKADAAGVVAITRSYSNLKNWNKKPDIMRFPLLILWQCTRGKSFVGFTREIGV